MGIVHVNTNVRSSKTDFQQGEKLSARGGKKKNRGTKKRERKKKGWVGGVEALVLVQR